MSRRVPNPSARPRAIKRRNPRGLGKGRIPTEKTRAGDEKLTTQEPLASAERAHLLASMNRRLPLS